MGFSNRVFFRSNIFQHVTPLTSMMKSDYLHAPISVFMRAVTRHCYKTVHVKKPVHSARCQRYWMGPPAHGAVARTPQLPLTVPRLLVFFWVVVRMG